MNQLLYTEGQVCQAYQLSRSTLRRKMSEGAIVPVRIGRSIRFPASEVERFVSELQAQARAERRKWLLRGRWPPLWRRYKRWTAPASAGGPGVLPMRTSIPALASAYGGHCVGEDGFRLLTLLIARAHLEHRASTQKSPPSTDERSLSGGHLDEG